MPDSFTIREANWSRSNCCLAMLRCKRLKNTGRASSGFARPLMIGWALNLSRDSGFEDGPLAPGPARFSLGPQVSRKPRSAVLPFSRMLAYSVLH